MKATKDRITEIIKEAAGDHVDVNSLKVDKPLIDQGVDSLDHMSFFMEIEEEYDVRIPDDDYQKLRSINDIVDYLNK